MVNSNAMIDDFIILFIFFRWVAGCSGFIYYKSNQHACHLSMRNDFFFLSTCFSSSIAEHNKKMIDKFEYLHCIDVLCLPIQPCPYDSIAQSARACECV